MAARKASDDMVSQAQTVNNSAIGKAVAVLGALRNANGPMTLTAIAEAIGVAPSSAHSILSHLLKESMVLQVQDKRYELGPQVFYLGAGFARSTPVYRATWMELVDAAAELSVTSAVAVPWGDTFLVLNSHRAGRTNVAMPFGGRVPLDASSWGKVYFAWAGVKPPPS
ncbi:helix-turn-helix domain-containing protein [Nocardioides humi]|uniref:helix-turn-helix domain-containing protein n=1 Tax=Nocardioides humi TaxID=449461 RepID=UPI0015E8672B|nr:helix-turn-helix domain-containing protein [Nocardioides humi]